MELVKGALKSDNDLSKPSVAVKAQARLQIAKRLCDKGCSPRVRASVFVAVGTVHAISRQDADAKAAFAAALKEDANSQLNPERSPPEAKKLFDEAKADAIAGPKPSPAPAAAPPPPPAEGQPALKKECKEEGAPPKDWDSSAAFCYFVEAVAAEAAQEWSECSAYVDASLTKQDRPTTRYLGAQCRERGGKWTEALREYAIVVETARRANMTATAREAALRAKLLKERIGKVVIRPPAGATELVVKLDGVEVPAEKLGGEIWVTPGQHSVSATGKLSGGPIKFNVSVNVGEAQTKAVDLAPGAGAASQDPVVLKCMLEAKDDDELAACVSKPTSSGLNFKVSAEITGYQDTDNTGVITPGVGLGVESPTDGWGVSGSFLVDVVTTASVDVVSSGSPRWTEIRYVPAVSGHKKAGDADISVSGNASVEPDYLAVGAGVGLSVDFAGKTVTPNIGYSFGYELSGRSGTAFSVFSLPITTHALVLGTTFVLNKTTIFVPAFTAAILFGDTSKPYRYLPIFAEGTTVLNGESVDSVNRLRLPVRVAEAVPDNRQRYAGSGLIAHRFNSVTLRLDERLYIDSWGLKATTTDFTLPVDFTDWLRVWPHLRAHAQTGVDFWERAYVATPNAGGLALPLLRTGDRELGPMLMGTGGLGTKIDFGTEPGFGVTLSGDAVYSRFLDHVYIQDRLALFVAMIMEAEFE